MPWFPDFVSAVELARIQTRAEGQADPVAEYLTALNNNDPRALETAWPGDVVIYDPRAGEVRGHRELRRFIGRNMSWLAGLHARTETVAATYASGRAVVELLAHLDGQELAWPVAVVAEAAFSATIPLAEVAKTATYTHAYAQSSGFLTLLSDGERLTGASALGPEAGEWLQQATLAIRARVPLHVLRDVIQPFPTFSEIYVATLKALHGQITAAQQPVTAGSP